MAKGSRSTGGGTTPTVFGANLKHLRRQRFPGWGGQRRFADFLNLSPNDLSVYENGRAMPNEQRLEEMASRLSMTVDELKKPLAGVAAPKAEEPAADENGGTNYWHERAAKLEQDIFRLEGKLEAVSERERELETRIIRLREANFVLRHLLYVDDSPEAEERRKKIMETLEPSVSELIKKSELF